MCGSAKQDVLGTLLWSEGGKKARLCIQNNIKYKIK